MSKRDYEGKISTTSLMKILRELSPANVSPLVYAHQCTYFLKQKDVK